MDNLSTFILPAKDGDLNWNSSILHKFCDYLGSETSNIKDIDYWNNVDRILCLLYVFNKYFECLSLKNNQEPHPYVSTSTIIFEFCITFLNRDVKNEDSLHSAILNSLMCSLLRGIFTCKGFLSSDILSIAHSTAKNQFSNTPDERTSSKSNVEEGGSTDVDPKAEPLESMRSTLQSNLASSEFIISDFITEISLDQISQSTPESQISGKIMLDALIENLFLSLKSDYPLHRILSLALSFANHFHHSLFNISFFSSNFQLLQHHLFCFFGLTSFPQLFDCCSFKDLELLANAAFDILHFIFFLDVHVSENGFSIFNTEKSAHHMDSESLLLHQCFSYNLIELALETCDNVALILSKSQVPEFICGNFRALQASLILKHLCYTLQLSSTEEYNNVLPLRSYFSIVFADASLWILNYLKTYTFSLDFGISPSSLDDPVYFDLSTSTNTSQHFSFLFQNFPILKLLCSLILNSYTRLFAVYGYKASETLVEQAPPQRIQFSIFASNMSQSQLSMNTLFAFLFTHISKISKEYDLTFIFKLINFLAKGIESQTSAFQFDSFKSSYSDNVVECTTSFLNNSLNSLKYTEYALFHAITISSPFIPLPPPDITDDLPMKHSMPQEKPISKGFSRLQHYYANNTKQIFSSYKISTSLISIANNSLKLLRIALASSQRPIMSCFIEEILNENFISLFTLLLNEVQDSPFRNPKLPCDFESFSRLLMSSFHNLLMSSYLSETVQISILDSLGITLDNWPLFIPNVSLFILSRIIFFNMKLPSKSNNHLCVRFWHSFLNSLERNVSCDSNFFNDVNYFHLQLMMFCFHYLSLDQRSAIVIKIIMAFQKFSQCKIDNAISCLASCRLSMIFEYILFNFSKIPSSLSKIIREYFFDTLLLSSNQVETSSTDLLFNDSCSKLEPKVVCDFGPRFYDLFNRSNYSFKDLDQGCLTLLFSFKVENSALNYSDIYSSLLELIYNFESFTYSSASYSDLLSNFALLHRFNSIRNVTSYLPAIIPNVLTVPIKYDAINDFKSLYMTMMVKETSINADLSKSALAYYVTTGLPEDKAENILSSQKLLLCNSFDKINVAYTFFTKILLSKELDFHVLLFSTSFAYLLFECFLDLEKLSLDEIIESFNNSSLFSNFSFAAISEHFPDSSKMPQNTDANANSSLPNDSQSDVREQAHSVKTDVKILGEFSKRIIPILLKVLNYLSNCCSDYFIHISSSENYYISKELLMLSAASPTSNNLTFFSNSCNIPLFDSFLDNRLKSKLSQYQNISQNNFEGLEFIDKNYSKGGFNFQKILKCYLSNMTCSDFTLVSNYKHSLSAISSLVQLLFKWCNTDEEINTLSSDIAECIHHAPLTSLFSGSLISDFVPNSITTFVKDTAANIFLRRSFLLLSCPNIRMHNTPADILNTFYSIITFSLKDVTLIRTVCDIFCDQSLDLFYILFCPIYPEFHSCITLSINTFAELLITLKDTAFNESKCIVSHLNDINSISKDKIITWFEYAMLGYENEDEKSIETRCDKLLVLANAISTGGTVLNSDTCQFILASILPLGYKLLDFIKCILMNDKKDSDVKEQSDGCFQYIHPCLNSFLPIITGLAEVHNVKGELLILESVSKWLPICRDIVLKYLYLKDDKTYEQFVTEFAAPCSFLSDLLEQIKLIISVVKMLKSRDGSLLHNDSIVVPTEDFESETVNLSNWNEFGEIYDDHETDHINDKLCTYTTTNKDYMKQHWYHCHTCKLYDSTGVCTICAKVCHKGHDVTYVKNSTFFCDCGAKGEDFCQSLFKRNKTSNYEDSIADEEIDESISSIKCTYDEHQLLGPEKRKESRSSTTYDAELLRLVEAIEGEPGLKERLYFQLENSDLSRQTLSILRAVVLINRKSISISPIRSYTNMYSSLATEFLQSPATIEYLDGLAPFSLGAPEGTFENVKLTFAEEHGVSIESLFTSSCIKRNAISLITSTEERMKQYMIVALDKGKFTTLHLASLFKTDSSNKKKVSISRICNVISSFPIISMFSNPFNDELVAFCGVRECSIYSINYLGQIVGHPLPVHIGIEASNFILKSFWLPISPTTLCIVTAQFIKIFELSQDCYSPIFFFALDSDTIADSTFISSANLLFLLIMTSSGHIYVNPIDQTCNATIGSSNHYEIEVINDNLEKTDSTIGQSGVSIYFSHSLQLVFFSFSQGLNFFASFNENYTKFICLNSILLKTSKIPPVLCQWTDSYLYPGLVCAQIVSSFVPILIYIRPKKIFIHEIKTATKSRVQGCILTVDLKEASIPGKASLVLLYEDGSLKIHYINLEKDQIFYKFNYHNPLITFQKSRKKNLKSVPTNFPIDFFESCMVTDEVEYGGLDILHIYNQEQVKKRLNSDFFSIVNTKPYGFKLEILNSNHSNFLVGFRIYLGNNSIAQTPSYIEIFHRQKLIEFPNGKPRWFDFPFTRDECLLSNKRFTITFGPSKDPSCINHIDSIKVYCKSRQELGLLESSEAESQKYRNQIISQPEDNDEVLHSDFTTLENELDRVNSLTITLLSETSHSFTMSLNEEAITQTSHLLTSLLDRPQKEQCFLLLFTLLPNLDSYYLQRDETIFIYAVGRLYLTPPSFFTPELFQHLLLNLHSIAIRRPRNLEKLLTFSYLQWCCEQYIASETCLELSQIPKLETLKGILDKIFETFWMFWNYRPLDPCLAPVGYPGLLYIKETMAIISAILYALIINDHELIPSAVGFIIQVLKCKATIIWDSFFSIFTGHFKPKIVKKTVKSKKFDNTDLKSPSPNQGIDVPSNADIPDNFLQEGFVSDENIQNPISNPLNDSKSLNPDITDPEVLSRYGIDPNQPINEDTLMNLALAMSLHDHGSQAVETETSDIISTSLSGENVISTVDEVKYLLEDQIESTEDLNKGEVDFTGEQSSTGTLTPPTTFSPTSTQLECLTKSKKYANDKFGEISSDQYGDSSGDDMDVGVESNAITRKMILQKPRKQLSEALCQRSSHLNEEELDLTYKMHSSLLLRMISNLKEILPLGGVKAILYMKLILILISSLEFTDQINKPIENCICVCIDIIHMSRSEISTLLSHTLENEVILILIRFLSLLLVRDKQEKEKNTDQKQPNIKSALFLTANALLTHTNCIDFCLCLLKEMIIMSHSFESEIKTLKSDYIVPKYTKLSCSDFVPFFVKQFSKEKGDIFEDYPRLLIETIMRLPLQLKKISDCYTDFDSVYFDTEWMKCLSEYMAIANHSQLVGRRNVRKLMLCISGSRDEYRKIRDMYAFESQISTMKSILFRKTQKDGQSFDYFYLEYDSQIKLLHCISQCIEYTLNRPENWQTFCFYNPEIIFFLVRIAGSVHEEISGYILHLLSLALCGIDFSIEKNFNIEPHSYINQGILNSNSTIMTESKTILMSKHSEILIPMFLFHSSHSHLNSDKLSFITHFLLFTNSESLRIQTQSFLWLVFSISDVTHKTAIFEVLCSNIHLMPSYGQKASQFIYLLCHCSESFSSDHILESGYVLKLVGLLKKLNKQLLSHPNSHVYQMLFNFVECDGYYLENEPCLVCNNPEISYSNIKLMSIKSDAKFTGHSIIVKLSSCFSISGFHLKINDIKRVKMVHTLSVYYSNKNYQSAVELKNKRESWIKAKEINLQAGQNELKIHLTLPIIACNVIIQYSDFYENMQSNPETLQCPRCSAPVPANPGICGNCSENVFQCHKCRAINYDEKDPFLCNSCGYSKFGKFEYSLTAKSCPFIESIETEDDRRKNVNNITTLLEKADQVYKQLLQHRQALDLLLTNSNLENSTTVTKIKPEVSVTGLNKSISTICQRYCVDCKSTFNELSKIIQGVLASRHELIKFDFINKQTLSDLPCGKLSNMSGSVLKNFLPSEKLTICYGCLSSATKHCITLLIALSRDFSIKNYLVDIGILSELCNTNLRIGTQEMQKEVQQLIVYLSRDNYQATSQLMKWLTNRISFLIHHYRSQYNLGNAVKHEMQLLTTTIDQNDDCWDASLRTLMIIFHKSTKRTSPVILEYITLPCLKIILQNIKNTTRLSHKYLTMTPFTICKAGGMENRILIDFKSWHDKGFPLNVWKMIGSQSHEIIVKNNTWLKKMLFHPSCQIARTTACSLFLSLMTEKHRRRLFIDLLIEYLPEISIFGESAQEYLEIFQSVISDHFWKEYLAAQGVFILLGKIIDEEVSKLSSLEDTTINVDISLGYTIKMISSILYQLMCPSNTNENDLEGTFEYFLETRLLETVSISPISSHVTTEKHHVYDSIFRDHKPKLLPVVLNSYLSLKRLIIQRTKRVDDAQDNLLQIIELMTSGTLEETQEFIGICFDTLSKFPSNDFRTPIVIFEELCSIIYPEESEIFEFFLCFEKESQQEEFLQGRMQNNPYSSNDSTIGPLMRDVKNKICRDTELLALLEEDTGLELLVCNKIINLDLSVKAVFKKVWLLTQTNPGNIMKIVYRMRGLLGEATEDIIDHLTCEPEVIDNEEKFKVASKISLCGGLESILYRLQCSQNPIHSIKLLAVSLKLLDYCIKLKVNRKYLLKKSLNTINILLSIFKEILSEEIHYINLCGKYCIESLLNILLEILQEASSISFVRLDSSDQFPEKIKGDIGYLENLLSCIGSSFVQNHTDILKGIMRIIPFLTYGDVSCMQLILDHFSKYLNYEEFDATPLSEHSLYLECFCSITSGISVDDTGISLKEMLVDSGQVSTAITYLQEYTPSSKDGDWSGFLSKPSLPFVLKFLAGISKNHLNIQTMIGGIIPQLHSTEKVTTIKGIGSLAENVLNSLIDNTSVYDIVLKHRNESIYVRKKKAEEYQKLSLTQMGISLSGQDEKLKFWEEVESLKEEHGLICCICMEGYCNHPRKILGIYTFSKSSILEEFENKIKKTQGYSTVSGFNTVHFDCHNTAIRTSRQSRGKDEWESALIHNSNIKCNSIMPIWGPEVQDNGFYSCLAKHHSCLQDATGCREPNFWSSVHDIKLLILRFTIEASFCQDSGGGSKYSNIRFLSYMFGYSFYLLQASRSFQKEFNNLTLFLENEPEKCITSSYELDGPAYFLVSSIFLMSGEEWSLNKIKFLRRLIIAGHARCISSKVQSGNAQEPLDFNFYRSYLMMFGLVCKMQLELKTFCICKGEDLISKMVEEYRINDRTILKIFEGVLQYYEEDLYPTESFSEFCDVSDLLHILNDPNEFLCTVISSSFKTFSS